MVETITAESVGSKFRQVLGQYPTGVCVIGAMDGDKPVGMTVGTFTSVSMEPPLVAFLPQKTSTTWPLVQRSGRFCVNVLSWEQEHLCRQMARPSDQKFVGVDWTPSGLGSPIIDGGVAWIDCEIVDVIDAGDHWIVLGAVNDLDVVSRDALPLVFFRGGYGRFTPGPLFAEQFDDPTRKSLLDTARVEMLQLERELGVDVAITGLDGNEMIMMASTWTPLSSRVRQRVGDAIPMGPPYAIAFVAEASREQREEWVRQGVELSGGGDREAMLATLELIAERGWSAAIHRRPVETWAERFVSINQRLDSHQAVDEEYNLTVPLHDAEGAVSLSLTVYGLQSGLSGPALAGTIDRLKDAALRIERVAQ